LKPQKAQAKRGKIKTRIVMQGSSNPWWLENISWCLSVFNYSSTVVFPLWGLRDSKKQWEALRTFSSTMAVQGQAWRIRI